MVAGRELDGRIECEIMERPGAWHPWVQINGRWIDIETWIPDYASLEDPPKGSHAGSTPRSYSTSIAAAWEVVEKLKADGWDIHLDSVGFNNDIEGEWRTFFNYDAEGVAARQHHVYEDGDTAAESICKCALAAVGIPPTSEEGP